MIDMKKAATFALALTSLVTSHNPAQASHHFESAVAKQYPAFDLTDLYVFESEKPGYTTFMMDVNPKTGNDGKAGFAENGVYSFHIAGDSELKEAGLTITAHLDGEQLAIGISRGGANQAVGVIGEEVGRAAVGTEATFENGMRLWSGAARDPFVGNSAGLRLFRGQLDAGKVDLESFKAGVDLFASLNSSVIVIEVPNDLLPKNIWVYATTAMYNIDKWEQVNRMANPLITHLFMYNNPMEISEHVGHRPDIDMGQRYAVSSTVLRAITLEGKLPEPVKYADSVAARLLPDMLPYEVGSKATYDYEKINGRAPQDDAMDTALSVFLGRPVTDHAETFDRHSGHFPYVSPIAAK